MTREPYHQITDKPHGNQKYTKDDIDCWRQMRRSGMKYKEIAKAVDVNYITVNRLLNEQP